MSRSIRYLRRAVAVCVLGLALVSTGCQTTPRSSEPGAKASEKSKRSRSRKPPIRRVRCLYEQRPWLNLDKAGDRDPEGIRYRAFLDPETGEGRGVLRDGMFHIELYRIDRTIDGTIQRTLASDWHYPTSDVHTIAKPGMLGEGYFVHLVWADKGIAGKEIELITTFEDPDGRKARSATKRMRVPKYEY